MKLKNRTLRSTAIGTAFIFTCVLVWWARVYSPLRDKAHELDLRVSQLTVEQHKLERRLKRVSQALREKSRKSNRFKRVPRTVKAKSLEEANAIIQAKMQAFFSGHDIQLNAYKELRPGKWGEYQVGKVEFSVTCTPEKLAELLQFLEKQEEGIRVDRLEVRSSIRRYSQLRVKLRLASLFINKPGKGV